MSTMEAIAYQAGDGSAGSPAPRIATSFQDSRQADLWVRRLDRWLRTGSPDGRAYLNFGSHAALIRWQSDPSSPDSPYALALVGEPAVLTGEFALELPDLNIPAGSFIDSLQAASRMTEHGPGYPDIEARARAEDSIGLLVPLLAHALRGERRVTMPATNPALPGAVMWSLLSILRMMADTRPISFHTHAPPSSWDGDTPGLFVSFRPDVATWLPPDQGFLALAADLAARFADDPAELRRTLLSLRLDESADHNGRISRLLSLPPRNQPGNTHQGGRATVMCPICLSEIPDWDSLTYWRYTGDDFEEIKIPPDANPSQRARYLFGAYVRCPGSEGDTVAVHHLPHRYGHFGAPVLLGFVGLTESGKTHLLSSMVSAIGRLSDYQVDAEPLDPALHQDFLDKSVEPLIANNQVLPSTPDDATTTLADAFIVRHGMGPERVVALFDVSGGNLVRRDKTMEFLWIADGLFFVIDPDKIKSSKAGDGSFNNVLGIVRGRAKPEPVSAAIVLNKADMARFDEPVARWLRSGDGALDPVDFLRESADVYAYLERHSAAALTEPYRACRKATLHVVSPTGGARQGVEKAGKYPRGVTPMRVLRPLVAMLAMTGVLTGPQAEQVGV